MNYHKKNIFKNKNNHWKESLRIILDVLRRYGFKISDVILLIFLFCFISVIGFFIPKILHELYSDQLPVQEQNYYLILLVGVYLAQYIVRCIYQFLGTVICRKVLGNLRRDVYKTWINDRSYWESTNHENKYLLGEVLSRMLNDTDALKELVDSGSITLLIDFVFVMSSLVSFLWIDIRLGCVFFIVQIIVIFALSKFSLSMSSVFHDVRKLIGYLTRELSDIIKGIPQIFDMKQDSYAIKRLKPIQEEYLEKQIKANFYDASYFSFAESLFPLFVAIFVITLPFGLTPTFAVFAVVIDLIQRSVIPIKEVASKMAVIQRTFTGILRVEEFRKDLKPFFISKDVNVNNKKNPSELDEINTLRFEIDKFHFNAKVTVPSINDNDLEKSFFFLENIRFSLFKGQSLGIIGKSGSGKSSILKLLSLELEGSAVKISLNKQSMNEKIFLLSNVESRMNWSKYICLVSQESHIFTQTLIYNITLELEEPIEFDIFWKQILIQLPYLTFWGINPREKININDVSFGQRQLIACLRALYLKRPVILFDEISSGLDSQLEESLAVATKLAMKDHFTIIVTHRLETIKDCDAVLYLENGQVLSSGTFRELFLENTKFKEFIKELTS